MSTDSEKDLADHIRTLRAEAANPWWSTEARDRLIQRALRLEERLLRLQAARRSSRRSGQKPAGRPRARELRQATAKALKPPDKLH